MVPALAQVTFQQDGQTQRIHLWACIVRGPGDTKRRQHREPSLDRREWLVRVLRSEAARAYRALGGKELRGFSLQRMALHWTVIGSDLWKLPGLPWRMEGETEDAVCQGTCRLGSQRVPGTEVLSLPSCPGIPQSPQRTAAEN